MLRWFRNPILVIVLAHAVAVTSATAQVKSCTPRNGTFYLVRFLPTVGEWDITPPAKPRIINKDRVEVCIEHFNFMRYTLRFDVTEEQSESYAYLTKLWTSVLNPTSALVEALSGFDRSSPRPSFLERLQLIYARATELDRAIGAQLAMYSKSGLDAAQAQVLADSLSMIASKLKVLSNTYSDLEGFLLLPANAASFESAIGGTSKVYEAVKSLYQAVVKRADLFLTTAQKTLGIEVRKVGTRSPGTKVTLKLAAVDEGGTVTPIGDVDYLVESSLPLLAHGGVAFAKLKDVDFEKIKRAAGASEEDLFQEKSSDDNSESITAFLAAQLFTLGGKAGSGEPPFALLFSLGTDVTEPGKKIFAGPSLAFFNRVILTAGAVLGKEAEGEQVTLEPNVFRIVREHPKTAFFFSLSIKVH